jgi:UDP:flavonoid glycosyltransferase YjiC (YdhE family)
LDNETLASYDVALACDPRYRRFVTPASLRFVPLASIEPAAFTSALRHGRPLYTTAQLEDYVRDDLAVMEREQPDIVVGDFRLSLSISARLARVPYIAISSAYWSPSYDIEVWPVPELPLTHALPIPIAGTLFRAARKAAFAMHARPLNAVRRKHGLASLGSDLRRVYTDADAVLYADMAELFPMSQMLASEAFVGPTLWEPAVTKPDWWDAAGVRKPLIYLTLGSSGSSTRLPAIASALTRMDAEVAIATAGAEQDAVKGSGILAADYLPGCALAQRAKLVVCNGGALTCYQALAGGVPILGVPSNLDQCLNMSAIEAAGAGLTVRADRLSTAAIQNAAAALLRQERFLAAASRLRGFVSRYKGPQKLRQTLQGRLGGRP